MELLISGVCPACGGPVQIVRELRIDRNGDPVPVGVLVLEIKPCSICRLADYNRGFADGAIPSAVENKGETNG